MRIASPPGRPNPRQAVGNTQTNAKATIRALPDIELMAQG
jgi:hypothetical protein